MKMSYQSIQKKGSKRVIVRTPFLTEIIVSDLLYFSLVIYKVDINFKPK